jgi:hypothetical protein
VRTMSKQVVLLTLATATLSLFVTGEARAAVVESQSVMTPSDSVFAGGMPYSASSDGQYVFSGQNYQGAPVYENVNSGWAMYRRADGKWYVDFNAVSEDWSGTIAYGTASAQTPWDTTWNGSDYVVTRTAAIHVESAAGSLSGTYSFTGQTYDGMPVYENGSRYVYTKYTRWVLGTTVGSNSNLYSYSATGCDGDGPWGCPSWANGYASTVARDVEVEIDSSAGSLSGVYTLEGSVSSDNLVWERSGRYVYEKYQRWVLGTTIGSNSNLYSYSETGCANTGGPWTCTSWTGYDQVAFKGSIVSETSVALKSAHNKYVVAEQAGGGDVNANRSAIGAWETLSLIELNSGYHLLRAPNGEFICPDDGGGADVHAYSGYPDESCYLTAFYLSNDKVAFMTESGHYLCGEGDGDFVADRTRIGPWEQFTVVNL